MWTYLLAATIIVPDRTPEPTLAPADTAPRRLAAFVAASRPSVDGRLSEPTWAPARATSDFRQVDPVDGADPTQRTEVWVAYDDDALYIAARLHDTDPAGIVSRLGRRDASTNSDLFVVAIDSWHDHRTAFRFGVNAAGVLSDNIAVNDAQQGDDSWDPVWDAAVRTDSAGWSVEMRIPFSQLRYHSGAPSDWGINFERFVARTGELDRWQWYPNSETGYASRFGHLTDLRQAAVTQARRLEFVPYAVAQGDDDSAIDSANPFRSRRDGRVEFGADLKYGLTSGLTLNGTINPDFGQVEADPAEVNLTVFETYFQERRPFFVEGANLFSFGAGSNGGIFGAPQLFYSRRIGRPPSGGPPQGAQFADIPEVTRILAAAKVSGVVNGWSVGLLDAVTDEERARVQLGDGSLARAAVEPRANVGVLSLRRDFNNGRTGFGAMATSLTRSIDDASLDFLRKSAHSAGVDFFHRFGGNQYSISGTASGSVISGSSNAIRRAQLSSARYYQRPDQDYVQVDPDATSLSGYAVSLSGGKDAGRWLIGGDAFAISPGFEINDAGFQNQADRIFTGVRATHRWLRPTKAFRFATWYLNGSQSLNFGGETVSRALFSGFFGQLHNFWSLNVNTMFNAATMSDKSTRGGPLTLIPPQWQVSGSISTDSRRSATASLFGNVTRNRSGGFINSAGLQVGVRPSAALSVLLAPSVNETHSVAGYVTSIADPTAVEMYGRRYIVADLTQRSFDMTVRTDMALSPRLSVQLYAQPFTASVDYSRYKAFARPRTIDFLVYGQDGTSTLQHDEATRRYALDADGDGPAPAATFGDPNFTLRSFRANLVLRWEYNPGSTLYLAWAHGRSGFSESSAFAPGSSLSDLWGDDQRNRVVLKLSYWFNP